MDVASVIRNYLKQPRFLVIVAVLALLAGAFGWVKTTIEYTATVQTVVAPPKSNAAGESQNPIAGIGVNNAQLALVVAGLASGADVTRAVESKGSTLQPVDTTVGGESAAPTFTSQVSFVAQGDSQNAAEAGAQEAVNLTKKKLKNLQDGQGITQSGQQVQLLQLGPPESVASSQTSRLRAAVGYALGMILLGLAATVFLGTRSVRRSRDDDSTRRGQAADRRS